MYCVYCRNTVIVGGCVYCGTDSKGVRSPKSKFTQAAHRAAMDNAAMWRRLYLRDGDRRHLWAAKRAIIRAQNIRYTRRH